MSERGNLTGEHGSADPWPPSGEMWPPAPPSPAGPPSRRPGNGGSTFHPRTGSKFALRRLGVLVLVLALVGSGVWWFGIRDDGPSVADPVPVEQLELQAWAPYWTLEHSLAQFERRSMYFSEVSPFWFQAAGVDEIRADPNAPEERTRQFLRAARAAEIPIVPSIVDATGAGGMANILASEGQRRRHVDAIVRFVERGDYDGVDLDYESFAFADGRDTWETTRPNWVTFIEELSGRLHAADKTLTVSIPPVFDGERTDDSGYWVYDYEAITPLVDHIRVMAYDYSTSEPGPIAPIDWVRSAAEGTADVSGDPSKLVLGLPIYGYNWPTETRGTCPPDDPNTERTTINLRTLYALLDKRGVADPTFVEETGESRFTYELTIGEGDTQCTQTRRVHFVDDVGAQLRLEIAKENGFGGVALWAFGFENGKVWDRLVPSLVKAPG
ncbi:MAG: glycosyl hydrolase family 18 protein [Actinomycetota bacterium]|nr:glycosyl hydrolase family 18 protein [Actinomycetota bacterium]